MGFRKAAAEQAAVKMSMYGPAGSGKTFSALLFCEGLAQVTGKRTAYVDTERGTDFYTVRVAAREAHPEAFDFDALYSRSLEEVLAAMHDLDPKTHGQIVLDSITHIWDTAIASYRGPRQGGNIPMWAWSKIKAPYKAIMKFLIDSPYHVFILGRQANVFEEDPATGDVRNAGFKMRAEGETAYEPHICIRMWPQRVGKNAKGKDVVLKDQVIACVAEKDRSGILQGHLIEWPTFDNVVKPLLGAMGTVQGVTPSEEDAAAHDVEARQKAGHDKGNASKEWTRKFQAALLGADTEKEVEAVNKKLTAEVRKKLTSEDLEICKADFFLRLDQVKGLNGQNAVDKESPTTVE
jgi:hypothetical protein